jgi:HSP20 family protein
MALMLIPIEHCANEETETLGGKIMLGTITRFDPVTEMRRMSDVFDRLFAGPYTGSSRPAAVTRDLSVPLDIVEKEDRFVIRAAVPGVTPDDLNVSIESNVLTITGEIKREEESENDKVYCRECSYGTFTRSVRLPENLLVDQVEATFDNGFVAITLPKAPEEKPRSVKVPIKQAK